MSALPSNVVDFKLPKKPRVKEKEASPDQRKVAVMPIRALRDKQLTDGMFRTLALVCSYCNRAGVTWVSQLRLSKDAGVSRQAITKQIKKLKEAGYIEVVSKHYRGIRPDTVRVIFDPTVDVDTAIAVTSSIEDTRPPHMKEEQMQDMTPDPEGLRRIQEMIKGVVKPMNQPPKEYTMPKSGDTVTVAKMKAEIAAKKKAKASHVQPNTVAISDEELSTPLATYVQPNEVAQNTGRTHKEKSLRDIFLKDIDLGLLKVLSNQLSNEEVEQTLQNLQARCQAEGVSMPTGVNLIEALLVLHADSL